MDGTENLNGKLAKSSRNLGRKNLQETESQAYENCKPVWKTRNPQWNRDNSIFGNRQETDWKTTKTQEIQSTPQNWQAKLQKAHKNLHNKRKPDKLKKPRKSAAATVEHLCVIKSNPSFSIFASKIENLCELGKLTKSKVCRKYVTFQKPEQNLWKSVAKHRNCRTSADKWKKPVGTGGKQ